MSQQNNLKDLFTAFAGTQDYPAAFNQLVDHMLIPLRVYDDAESQAAALKSLAAHKQLPQLLAMMEKVGALCEGFGDPLGTLYQELISKGRLGQFFTPSPIADLMAMISIGNSAEAGKTVLDCACGSGAMLLSAAKVDRRLRLYGADIDHTLCKVALVNMLLNSLTGEIAHMDSLANEFYVGYRFGTVVKGGFHVPYYRVITEKEESAIWRRGEPGMGG